MKHNGDNHFNTVKCQYAPSSCVNYKYSQCVLQSVMTNVTLVLIYQKWKHCR